jgi:hypothetical protein
VSEIKNIPGEATVKKTGIDRVVPTHNRWRSLNVNIYLFTLIGLLLFLGTCQASQSMGWWSTSGKITSTGEKVTATGTDPAEIKGWMTIKEVLAAYKIPWEEFSKQFNIPPGTSLDSPLSSLEALAPGFSVTNLRTWITERMKK